MLVVSKVVREEIFTFTPEGEEEETTILSGKLRAWLLEKHMDKVIPLTFPEQPLDEIVKMHGLEEPRMASMTIFEASEPVIVGIWPSGFNVLIDGGHRRWFWAKQGVHTIKGWAVPEAIWRSFTADFGNMNIIAHHRDGSLLPHRRSK